MNTPNGLVELEQTFGVIHPYIGIDGHISPAWEKEHMDRAHLPFPITLSWDDSVKVDRILCHKLLVPVFENVFNVIVEQGLQDKIQSYGGCYAYRAQRGSSKLSTHAWGIAIDLNVATNQQGTVGDMDRGIVQIFTGNGFIWGGTFIGKRRDSMHFQFVNSY